MLELSRNVAMLVAKSHCFLSPVGFLLDSRGRHLLENRSGRLLA
jgi:hypothetical protein